MDHFAGLDVAVKETSVCIVNGTGGIVREVGVANERDALLAGLKSRIITSRGSTGSLGTVATAVQRSRGSGLASDLCQDAAHSGCVESADQTDRLHRCLAALHR